MAPESPSVPTQTPATMMVQSPHRPPAVEGSSPVNDDIFSPTSAAALALSSLHHFGADQRNNSANSRSLLSLRGTRLFNTTAPSSTSNENTESPTTGTTNDGSSPSTIYQPGPPPPPKTSSSERKVEVSRPGPATASEASMAYSPSPSMPPTNSQTQHYHHHPPSMNHQYHHPHHGGGGGSLGWRPAPSQQTPSPPMPIYHHTHHPSAPTPGPPPRSADGMPMFQQHQRQPPPMEGYHHLQHFQSCSTGGSSFQDHPQQRRTYFQEQQHSHAPHQPWNSQPPVTPVAANGPGSATSGHHGYPQPMSVPSAAGGNHGYPNHSMYHGRYTHPPTTEQEHPEKILARLASCATTLVTPTPKKQKYSTDPIPSTALPYTRLLKSSLILTSSNNASNHGGAMPPMSAAEVAMNGTGYSRKKKSLGVLAENFIRQYHDVPANGTTEIIVDDAAVQLGVERRRIYDVVNILEAIGLVSKKHKNTYAWLGMHPDHLSKIFGHLQAAAIAAYPEDAGTFLFGTAHSTEKQEMEQGLQGTKGDSSDPSSKSNEDTPAPPTTPPSGSISMAQSDKGRENKSLAKLSQEFLQIFLVGHEVLSLPEASDKIQGTTSMEELIAMGTVNQSISSASTVTSTPAAVKPKENGESTVFQPRTPSMVKEERERKAAAARGLKTKIRRLYDIANVFLSVGLLRKVEGGDSSRRPNFAWDYPWSAKQLYHMQQQREKQLPTPPMPRGGLPCHTHPAAPERQWGGAVTTAEVRHSVQNWQAGDKMAQ